MTPTAATGSRRRAVFVSDVHLGSKHCHAAELADFLATVSCERLYLVGDIVDLWYMAQRRAAWGQAQNRVVEALHALRRALEREVTLRKRQTEIEIARLGGRGGKAFLAEE